MIRLEALEVDVRLSVTVTVTLKVPANEYSCATIFPTAEVPSPKLQLKLYGATPPLGEAKKETSP